MNGIEHFLRDLAVERIVHRLVRSQDVASAFDARPMQHRLREYDCKQVDYRRTSVIHGVGNSIPSIAMISASTSSKTAPQPPIEY